MISPTGVEVDMPIGKGFVGMVNREVFDEFLRARAAGNGAERRTGTFQSLSRDADGLLEVHYSGQQAGDSTVSARIVVGADGANSAVRREPSPTCGSRNSSLPIMRSSRRRRHKGLGAGVL